MNIKINIKNKGYGNSNRKYRSQHRNKESKNRASQLIYVGNTVIYSKVMKISKDTQLVRFLVDNKELDVSQFQ